jgi:hypothetical protein
MRDPRTNDEVERELTPEEQRAQVEQMLATLSGGPAGLVRHVYWRFAVAMGEAADVAPEMEFAPGTKALCFDLGNGEQFVFAMAADRWREFSNNIHGGIHVASAVELPKGARVPVAAAG